MWSILQDKITNPTHLLTLNFQYFGQFLHTPLSHSLMDVYPPGPCDESTYALDILLI